MTAPRSETATDVDSVRVDLGARGYDILVGAGLLAAAGHYIRPLLRHPRVVVITDSNVAPLYLAAVETALGEADIECTAITLPAGEQTKDFAHLEALAEDLLAGKVGRDTTLVALGGGVIGDLAGFAAAITMRGMDFVQIPTTLLAQVDSAVGGKTGINTRHGKNLVGAFHQPRLVLSDIATLDTLPERELVAGYAEVVKYGLIRDAAFFRWLETNGLRLCGGDTEARRHAVAACCAAKAAIVAEDEREAGRRALLNLGHTFGHALEAQSGFGDTLLHGEAVAIGMVLAFELSARLGPCPPTPSACAATSRKWACRSACADRPIGRGAPTGFSPTWPGTRKCWAASSGSCSSGASAKPSSPTTSMPKTWPPFWTPRSAPDARGRIRRRAASAPRMEHSLIIVEELPCWFP